MCLNAFYFELWHSVVLKSQSWFTICFCFSYTYIIFFLFFHYFLHNFKTVAFRKRRSFVMILVFALLVVFFI